MEALSGHVSLSCRRSEVLVRAPRAPTLVRLWAIGVTAVLGEAMLLLVRRVE